MEPEVAVVGRGKVHSVMDKASRVCKCELCMWVARTRVCRPAAPFGRRLSHQHRCHSESDLEHEIVGGECAVNGDYSADSDDVYLHSYGRPVLPYHLVAQQC